ncbi:HSF-type DNA-binding-domain-containing protein [Choanephora cucurbitarum]|nr:HSF-type DNA-binding-domain-containing protein [Choanephora cucurbitarum]
MLLFFWGDSNFLLVGFGPFSILATESFREFIFWVDQGQVICVPNAVLFSQNILPKFFKHSNWQSFVRQLNLYGFRKVYQLNLAYDDSLEKRIVWQFKHDHFQRDHPELLCEIKRRTTKVIQQQNAQQNALQKQKQDEELQAQQDKSEEDDDDDDENETGQSLMLSCCFSAFIDVSR